MSLILSGTNGLSDVDGTAATPAIRGTDANTGIFFPAADTIAFSEGGTEAMRIDSSGNVGIGTSSPQASAKLHVFATGDYTDEGAPFTLGSSSTNGMRLYAGVNNTSDYAYIGSVESGTAYRNLVLQPNGGNLLVGTTTAISTGRFVLKAPATTNLGEWRVTTNGYAMIMYNASDTQVGFISINASTTTYNTGSDYRLKENIAPMTGALAKVAQLKPCTYTWKATGKDGQGFIAHELSEVVPDAVSGEKDAVDEKGNPRYQGVDTSFLVATLTAAIQEQQALITTLTDRITALEAK